MQNTLRISFCALLAVLATFNAHANTDSICDASVCTPSGFSPLAFATTRDADGLYDYSFFVGPNVPASITLPYFPDSGAQNVSTPEGWTFTTHVEQNVPGNDHYAGTMTWAASANAAGPYAVFSYRAAYAPGNAQVSALMPDGTVSIATLPIPVSPDAVTVGVVMPILVPEAGTMAMVMLGIGGIALARCRASA